MAEGVQNQFCDGKPVSSLSLVSVRRFLEASDHYSSLYAIIQKCPVALPTA